MNDLAAFASRRLATRWAGHPLVLRDCTGSTNDDARTAARSGAPHGYTVIADVQSAGRGRSGRAWWAAPGCAVLVSIVVRPTIAIERVPLVTLAIGLAVAETVDTFVDPARVTIKWPNDVRIDGAKVAGILVEGSVRDATVAWLVAGVGLNVRGDVDDILVTQAATSLERSCGARVERDAVLARLMLGIERWIDAPLDTIVPAVRARCDTIGAPVTSGDVRGVAVAIDDDGALRVRDEHGIEHAVRSGEVVTPAG